MLRRLALVAAISLGVAAIPAAAVAAHGGGGGGHGGGGGGGRGGGGGFSGGHSFSGGGPGFTGRSFSPGFTSRAVPGGNAFVSRGVTGPPLAGRGVQAAPLAGRYVTGHGRYAWNGHHRIHGRHIHGFIPGFGYGYYWYYGDCWAWTDYGWINICSDVY